ncbi:MAG: hypothetical protein EPO32_04935 [Anaerolineae bacterium]|nr:MAG: hypothetical protein EPO32_04935 [Anaerolineae bacterium]
MAVEARALPKSVALIDRIYDWIERLPIPGLLFFGLFYVAVVTIHHLLMWADGSLPAGEFSTPVLLTIYLWATISPGTYYYMRRVAVQTIDGFRSALDVNDAEFEALRVDFSRLPRRAGAGILWFSFVIMALAIPSIPSIIDSHFFTPYSRFLFWPVMFVIAPFSVSTFYYAFRSLGAVSRVYDRVKQINLFNLSPLYGLSVFTSRVGMVFILYTLLNQVTADAWGDAGTGDAIAAFYLVLNSGTALLAFIVPLYGIHLRLVAEKERVSEENNARLNKAFWDLQNKMDTGKLDDIGQFRTGVSALMEFRAELKKIPTWPWDAGTLRQFLTALFIPLTVWSLQQILLRMVQ